MQVEIKVPSAGESVSEATVAQILKQSGTVVKKDEEILELETDKVNQVIFAPEAGKLTLTVNEGDTVTIGQVLGTIDTDAAGAPAEEPKQEDPAPEVPKQEDTPPEPKQEEAPPATPTTHKARISEDDTINSFKHSAAAPQQPAPPRQESAPLPKTSSGKQERKRMSGLRKTIAKRLVEVKNQTAMLTTFNEADMSAVMEIRSQEKEAFLAKHGVKLGFMSFFVKAVCAALKEYPDINAFIDGDEIVYNETFDIGVAVSTDRGLMVPIIRNAGSMEFHEIEKKILDYANAAREGKLSIDDLSGGTFTITNGGTFGSLLSTPILNPPQSGILGMHSILKRPVAKDDNVVVRPMMYLALSYDHRIVDGKEAVGFLVHIKQSLEEPARLLLDF